MEDLDDRFLLPIPGKIKLRMEVINGVGIKELTQTIIAGVIGIFIAIFINSVFHNYLVAVGSFMLITGATLVIVMKDKNNTSIADLIRYIIFFFKHQRFYKYVIEEEKQK